MPNVILRWSDPPDARVRLVCWPHAGAGATRFRPWRAALPADVALWAVCLPGRERRIREAPHREIGAAAQEALAELAAVPAASLALFGHCSGALIALEVARRLCAGPAGAPRHLFVAGQIGPASIRQQAAVPQPRSTPARDPAELVQDDFGGRAVDPGLLAVLAAGVEADMALVDSFDASAHGPLPVPITAFLGTDDLLPREQVGLWREESSAAFALEALHGSHLLTESWEELPRRIVQALSAATPGAVRADVA